MNKDLVKQKTPEIMEWTTDSGKELVLSVSDIREYFTDNDKVTDKECVMFGQICSSHKLDPWLRDAYLIKFGTMAAQLIVGKNAVLKIAHRNKNFDGFQAGIIVLDKNNKVTHREGSMVYDCEKLVGGWAKAFRKDKKTPFYTEVSLKEYAKKTKDGRTNSQWTNMAPTMIRKVPLVHVLREAFPEDLRGIYDESEVDAMRNTAEDEKQNTKSKVADIFNKKDETIIEGEIVETQEDEPDLLLNELKILVRAVKLSDEKINDLFEKHNVSSWEELSDETKQKCIDRLKPQYEKLKQEKTQDSVKEALKQNEMFKE